MFADVEIISNNTYKFQLFTYSVPKNLSNKIDIGSIVSVNFRNRKKTAVVVNIHNKDLKIKTLKGSFSVIKFIFLTKGSTFEACTLWLHTRGLNISAHCSYLAALQTRPKDWTENTCKCTAITVANHLEY